MAIAKPLAKASYRVDRVEDIGRGIARAIRTAVSGRPGGVYLDIPGDVLAQTIDASAGAATLWKVSRPRPRANPPRTKRFCGRWSCWPARSAR